MCLKNRSRLGVLNGDLATIANIDPDRRNVTIRLDRDDRLVSVPHWYLDDGHLDWGYALTGHKAQGATAQRAHTVAGDGVDREWIYVTMSRGREANTIYLTQPDPGDDECEHLAHQNPSQLPALIGALARTATEPAAVDHGRGPSTLSDEDLHQRTAELQNRLNAINGSPGTLDGRADHLVEYLRLRNETEARHRDRIAAIKYEPPDWIVDAIGERPAEPQPRAAWDRIVDRAIRYRFEYDLGDDTSGLIGAAPPSREIARRAAWIAVRSSIDDDLKQLTDVGRRLTPAVAR